MIEDARLMQIRADFEKDGWIDVSAFRDLLAALTAAERQLSAQAQELERVRAFLDDINDRSIDDLKQGIREGTFVGDPYGAPNDCETHIIVTRGELRGILAASRPIGADEEGSK